MVFLKKSLKFCPKYGDLWPLLKHVSFFILGPIKTNVILKESSRKQDTIISSSPNYVKIDFILLTKPIVLKI